MKQVLVVLLFLCCTVLVYGQQLSLVIDEMTAHHLRQLPKEQQIHFDSILQNRLRVNWFKRMDELTFDYAFIEETVCERTGLTNSIERYFNQGDSIPRLVYGNGEEADPGKIYDGFLYWYSKNVTYYHTFKPLLEKYSGLQPVQELAYDKMQVWQHGCVTQANGAQIFEEKRIEELKTTYRINTMIDKKTNTLMVSIQVAPKEPKFETRPYNPVWDW